MTRLVQPLAISALAAALLCTAAGNGRARVAAGPGVSASAAADSSALGPGDAPPAPTAADSLTAPFRIVFFEPEPSGAPDAESRPAIQIGARRDHTRWDRRDPWSVEPASFLRYNRVEGIGLSVLFDRGLDRKTYQPAYRAGIGYAFAPQRGQFILGMEQPLTQRAKLTLGAMAYRRFLTFFYGDEIIDTGENSASALFLHRDYRDWYEADGVRGWIGFHTSPYLTITAGVTSREERSLRVASNWSLFRQTTPFRTNPKAAEGNYRAYDATLTYDSRPRSDRSHWGSVEHFHRLRWERAEKSLSGDFDLWRLVADSRVYLRLSPAQSLAVRALVGTGGAREGRLPSQRRFFLGGIGTLRGHGFRSLEGDHAVLTNIQYEFDVSGSSRALVVLDTGTAFDGRDLGALFEQKIAVDLGAGLRLGENGVQFLLSRSINRRNADVNLTVRFQDTF